MTTQANNSNGRVARPGEVWKVQGEKTPVLVGHETSDGTGRYWVEYTILYDGLTHEKAIISEANGDTYLAQNLEAYYAGKQSHHYSKGNLGDHSYWTAPTQPEEGGSIHSDHVKAWADVPGGVE